MPKRFGFNFDLPKDVDENWKRKIKLTIKTNESSAQIIMKNKIKQLLLNSKHGNIFLEHRKQQNK